MISFIVSVVLLFIGWFLYSRVVEKVFCPDDRQTPAIAINDGVDCTPLKTPKAFLIQLLNIAGTGPIFGALMGAEFGPCVFLWIVFGSILGGAVHDYMVGMISCRHEGKSIAELSGIYLSDTAKWIMRLFSILLLLLVGAVFVTSPAALIARLTPKVMSSEFWVCIIIIYYALATILPINKLIGKLYPLFGIVLMVMAVGIIGSLIISKDYTLPEITLSNLHPENKPVWPYMFITVACGAISGFHATQSPMISKCITKEKSGRNVFYGAMIAESIIALVWAAAGVTFYKTTGSLSEALSNFGQSGVVYDISFKLMGTVGGILAIIGVVICPITSGDTAFRSARLILAEWTGLEQKQLKNRLIITIPLLCAGALLTQLDFDVLWRYFAWSNQTLATIALFVATAYILKNNKHKLYSLITALPATFMMAVTSTYILMADEGFKLKNYFAYPIGIGCTAVVFIWYLLILKKYTEKTKNKL